MRRLVLLLVPIALLGAACSTGSGPGHQGSAHPSGSTTTSAPAPSSTTTSSPSALDTMGPYLLAVVAADAALKKAAAAVNGDVGTESLTLSPATKSAIEAASPAGAGAAIPAGLPGDLLDRVMLVQSDLVSRWAALLGYSRIGGTMPVARSDSAAQEALSCLSNAGPAATSMQADVRALTSAAAQVPPVTAAAPDSQQAADVQILLQNLELRNLGCASCGGTRSTSPSDIIWYPTPKPSTVPGVAPTNGTIDGVEFEASYAADSGWTVMIHAC